VATNRGARRRPDHRRVRMHRSYSVAEAAERLGVCRNTVRNYLKRGLPSLKTSAGVLILGQAIRDFLSSRKAAAKSPCPPGHMYCFRCRAPRRPPPGLVELIWAEGRPLNLRGLCPECEALMHRRVGKGGPAAAGFMLPSDAWAPTPNR
jgi:hypothetical protein